MGQAAFTLVAVHYGKNKLVVVVKFCRQESEVEPNKVSRNLGAVSDHLSAPEAAEMAKEQCLMKNTNGTR